MAKKFLLASYKELWKRCNSENLPFIKKRIEICDFVPQKLPNDVFRAIFLPSFVIVRVCFGLILSAIVVIVVRTRRWWFRQKSEPGACVLILLLLLLLGVGGSGGGTAVGGGICPGRQQSGSRGHVLYLEKKMVKKEPDRYSNSKILIQILEL